MPVRTRAAVVSQPGGSFLFQDVELDGPRQGEVLVRMVACGICHTDIAARDGLFGLSFPSVLGHEGAGIVESVGSEVTRVRPGERVAISFASCGKCSNCLAGHPAHCAAFDELNFGSARPDGSSAIHDAGGASVGCFSVNPPLLTGRWRTSATLFPWMPLMMTNLPCLRPWDAAYRLGRLLC